MAQELIADLRIKISRLEAKNKALEQKVTQLQGQASMGSGDSSANVDQLQNAINEKDQQIATLNNQLAEAMSTASLSTDSSALQQELDALKKQQEVQLKEKDNQVISLQKEVNELQNKVKQSNLPTGELIVDLNRKIERLNGVNKKQKIQLEKYKSLENSKEIIDNLEKQLKKLTTDVDVRDQTIQQRNEEITSLKNKIQSFLTDDRLSKLEKEVDKKDNEIFALEGQVRALQDKSSQQETVIEQLNLRIQELTAEDLQAELQKKEGTILLLKDKISSLESDISTINQNYKNLQAENNNLREALDSSDLERKLKEQMNLNNNLNSDLESRLLQIKSLNETIKERDLRISQLEAIGASDAAQRLERENLEFQEQVESQKARIELFQERIQELEQEIEEAGTKQQQMRIRELRSLLGEFKKRQRQSQGEINYWKRKSLEQGDSLF